MNLRDEVDKIRKEGYSEANAEAKLCQDIIIKAISQSTTIDVNDADEIRKRAERIFNSSIYRKQVERSKKNWLDLSVEEVLNKDLELIYKL